MQLPYRVPPVLHRAYIFFLFLLLACVTAFFAGCNAVSYAPGPEFSPRTYDYLRLEATAAFDACMATCSENSSLALVTRNGCFAGCEEARRSFPLRGKAFSSRQACLDALMQQELRKDHLIREMRLWCDAQWTHVHNRRGCYTAAETFYANLSPAGMCGTDGAETAIYDMSLAQARERGAEDEPEQTPSPAPPAATETAQPAGPLIPPPYVPEETRQTLGGSPASPEARQPAGALPAIHDTPKYQKMPASGSREAKPVTGSASVPANTPTPPSAAAPPAPAPQPENPVPPAQQQADPGSAPQAQPAASAAPAVPSAAPQSPPDQPALAAPSAPASPPPGSAVTIERTAPSGEGSGSASPGGSKQADSPVPAQEQPDRTPDLPDAGATPAYPMPGPPVPGLNANRPAPSSPEPADSPPSIQLPVPSMLDRPYSIPPLLAPQIEVPE